MNYVSSILISAFLLIGGFTAEDAGVKVGDTAIDFNLKNVDGKMISLKSDANAKGYILVFTCNTCPYSKMYEDRIIALHKKYAGQGYPVVAIQPNNADKSPGDSYPNMQKRAKEKGFPFPYVLDETQETTEAYGATNTPHVYVLNKEGGDFKVAYIGAIDNNSRNASAATRRYVEEAIDALSAGNSVGTSDTKAIGCTIKWAN
ncbi:MAG: thioredoxin family protein [Roseivirga sp.]|nr:thioredoxin family protein [Roseivirga sp.]